VRRAGPVVLSNGAVFHVSTVRLLLEWGADWNLTGEHGVTLLHLVCAKAELFPLFKDMVEEHEYTLNGPPPSRFNLPSPAVAAAAAEDPEETKGARARRLEREKEAASRVSRRWQSVLAGKVSPLLVATLQRKINFCCRGIWLLSGGGGGGGGGESQPPLSLAPYH